jgi:protein gp37
VSGSSKIEWTNATWNPLTGCTLVSEGCRNCYAARETAGRLSHLPQYQGLARKIGGRPVFTGEVRLHPDRLDQPLRWRKPRRVFVNSMSDLFHEDVPFPFIDQVFAVMALAPQHTFQVLTKRPQRMAEYLADREDTIREAAAFEPLNLGPAATAAAERMGGVWEPPQIGDEGRVELAGYFEGVALGWPLPNVWLGTSVENQETADKRIPHLLATPAAVRFLSCEPLLGPVSLDNGPGEFLRCPDCGYSKRDVAEQMDHHLCSGPGPGIDWVIVGGESGPNARPMHPDWALDLRDQCVSAGVPYFFKQWGEWIHELHPAVQSPIQQYRLDDEYVYPTDDGDYQGLYMARVGKKAAGRELDGRTWDEMPEVPA